MKITLLVDNPRSWYASYAQTLQKSLSNYNHKVFLVHDVHDITEGDLAFFLSCETIIKKDIRDKNTLSLVVHSSSLPKGKGWSPLTWQILEGKNDVTNTLFEAVDRVDAGQIFMQNSIQFEGHELLPELHDKQGKCINELIEKFVEQYPNVVAKQQIGEESFYRKRTSEDSELNVNKNIEEQFNLLRIVDNEKYPAFFCYKGQKYILKIYKQ